jgi:hypothetical protein
VEWKGIRGRLPEWPTQVLLGSEVALLEVAESAPAEAENSCCLRVMMLLVLRHCSSWLFQCLTVKKMKEVRMMKKKTRRH